MSRSRSSRRFLLATLTLFAAAGMGVAAVQFRQHRSSIDLTALLRDDRARTAVEVQRVAISGVERDAISAGAPRAFTAHDVAVPADARLELTIGIEEDVWNLDGDGVLFRVHARQGGKKTVLYSRYLDAKKHERDRGWIEADVPLAHMLGGGPSSSSTVDLTFSTSHGFRGDDKHDAAVWADLRIAPVSPFAWIRPQPQRRPNVLLLSIDTLRADHVGAFGYERGTTPAIDDIAAQGFRFHRAHAPANHTLESHMSVLTGLYSTSHDVRRVPGERGHRGIRPLPQSRITLAEVLQAHGYVTAGFVYNCLWLGTRFGFAQGFDHYADKRYAADGMNDRDIFPWLDAHHSDPFFLFVHYYDVHSDWKNLPYDAPPEFRTKFVGDAKIEPCDGKACATNRLTKLDSTHQDVDEDQLAYLRSLYDAGVAATDHQVGRLIDKLRSLEVLDDTLVIVMADHGEEFREHGRFIHAQHYQEILRVPLIFRLPDALGVGGESHQPVQLIDIAPTVLDLLGLRYEDPIQGRSLKPLLRGNDLPPRPLLFFGPTTNGIIDWPWKLIDHRKRSELYNLEQDPLEKVDVSGRQAQRVARLRQVLASMQSAPPAEAEKSGRDRPTTELNEGEVERLRALGYLQ